MATRPTKWNGPSDDWCWEHDAPCVAWDDDEEETPIICSNHTSASDCDFDWAFDANGEMIPPRTSRVDRRKTAIFYRRKCKVCGRGMNSGYIGDWDTYCSDECARKDIPNFDELIERAEEDDDAPLYWTDWEEDDEESEEVGFEGDENGLPLKKSNSTKKSALTRDEATKVILAEAKRLNALLPKDLTVFSYGELDGVDVLTLCDLILWAENDLVAYGIKFDGADARLAEAFEAVGFDESERAN